MKILFNYKNILYLSLLTYSCLSIIYPQYFIFADIRFNSAHSNSFSYLSAFIMSNNLNNLNFDAWSFFDHNNHSYEHVIMGFYTIPAFIEALFFNITNFFFLDNAKLFQFIHTYIFAFISIILKTIGIIMICDFYKIKKILYIPIIIVINVFLTFVSHIGYENSYLYSLSIILIYFLIVFFYNPNILPLIYFFIFYIFCFSQSPYQSMSYFFIPFHFLGILILVSLYFNKNFTVRKFLNLKNHNLNYKFLIPSILIIILFNIFFFILLSKTQTMSEVGINNVSRFEKFLNPIAYFKTYVPTYRSAEMFSSFFNFFKNEWWNKPMFIGFISYFISLIGILYSKRKEKYLFLIVIIYIIGLQGPRDILFFDISFYANLFNAFLNPFSFLNQHTHMILLLLPFFLVPLVIIGFEALYDLKQSTENLAKKNVIFLLLNLALLLFLISQKLDNYVIYIFITFFFILFSYLSLNIKKKYVLFTLIFFLILIEGYNFKTYVKKLPVTSENIVSRKILNLSKNNEYNLDVQNPIFNKLPLELVFKEPAIEEIYKLNVFSDKYFDRQVASSLFYKNTLLFNIIKKDILYEKRHKIYTDLAKDLELTSLNKNLTLFKFYNDKKNNLDYLTKTVSIPINDLVLVRKEKNGKLYKFKNPSEMPEYLYSNIFSNILTINLNINNQNYFPIQNVPANAFSFDTNNVENNFTYFFFSADTKEDKNIYSINLTFTYYNYIKDIKKNGDRIVINLSAPTDGYLLIRQPYNEFWIGTKNSKQTKLKISEKYWLAFHVPSGNSIVELKYSLSKYFSTNFAIMLYYLASFCLLIFSLKIFFRRFKIS